MTLNAKQLFPEIENMEVLQHQMVTKKDLLQFGNLLLEHLKAVEKPNESKPKYLRSSEVRKLLQISPGTLQNLRITGTLKPSKIGGILYYNHDDIEKMLNK